MEIPPLPPRGGGGGGSILYKSFGGDLEGLKNKLKVQESVSKKEIHPSL